MPECLDLSKLNNGDAIELGSAPECDISISHPSISSRHCRILARSNGIFIRDMESRSGTFINKNMVSGLQRIMNDDLLSLGEFTLVLKIPDIYADAGCKVDIRNISVAVGKRETRRLILNNVSLSIAPGEFVGIVGPSGCGKSTLMTTLAGIREPVNGTISLDGTAYAPDALREKVGFLPQFVVIHGQLTVRKVIAYAGELTPLNRQSSHLPIADTLERVGLQPQVDQVIKTLSGGQQKRAGLALELRFQPNILCLDEVTSGLDPLSEKEMMILFKELSTTGKTVLCITHYPDRLVLCDKLIVLFSGRMIFYGSPEETLNHFNLDSLGDLYEAIEQHEPQYWAQLFHPTEPPGNPTRIVTAKSRFNPLLFIRQLPVQILRYVDIWRRNQAEVLLLLLQGVVIGILISLCFGVPEKSMTYFDKASRAQQILFSLILATTWIGSTTSVREIVKERNILIHEGRRKLSALAYLLSKLVVLSVFSATGVTILAIIVIAWTNLPGNSFKLILDLLLISSVSSALGLTVSAIANTQEKALSILPVAIIGLALFSGGIQKLKGFSLLLGKIGSFAFWSFDLAKHCLPDNILNTHIPMTSENVIAKPLSEHMCIIMLCVYLVLFTIIGSISIARTIRKG